MNPTPETYHGYHLVPRTTPTKGYQVRDPDGYVWPRIYHTRAYARDFIRYLETRAAHQIRKPHQAKNP